MNELSLFGKETNNPSRLIAFSDGIFAIAVTLLAFNLKILDIDPEKVHEQLPVQIKAMTPHFFTYVVSFRLVGVYWTIHHRMLDRIAHVDSTFIWLTIAYLLMISFMSFPAGLISTYPHERVIEVFYLGSAAAVSVLSMTMWRYASHKLRLLNKEVSKNKSGISLYGRLYRFQ